MTLQAPLSSWISYRSGEKHSPISSLTRVAVQAISSGPHWHGLHLEVGAVDGWDGDDMMVDGHLVAINRGDRPLRLDVRNEQYPEWTPHVRSPGAFWIHPEGWPLSVRLRERTDWGAAIIDGKFLDAVMGGHYELRAGEDIADPLLAHLFRALIEVLLTSEATGTVIESTIRSFVLALGSRHGCRAADLAAKSGLSPAQVQSLLQWIEVRLDTRITVSAMAEHIGLSRAHLSRELKRATGRTPWELVLERRLELARELLTMGESACATASRCGFFDQAHLCRVFKQRYGLSPSAFAGGALRRT